MGKKKLIFILIAAAFFTYFSSFSNPFIWDDEQFITSNAYVQNFDLGKIFTTNTVAGAGVQSNYYRPLTTLSFAIDTKLFGQNPFGFHLVNTLLHIGAGVFLFLLLFELFSLRLHSDNTSTSPVPVRYGASSAKNFSLSEQIQVPDGTWRSESKGNVIAFFISLIFLVHPIQTEAVVYINSRGDSLYTFFLFSALYLFTLGLKKAQYVLRVFHRNVLLSNIWIYSASVFLFICSLLSKEIALAGVGLYVGVLLLLYISRHSGLSRIPTGSWVRSLTRSYQDDSIRKGILSIGAIALIIIVYLALRLTMLNFGNTLNFYGGETEYTRSLAIRLFTFAKVVWVYLELLVWPSPLHMERSVSLVKTFFSPWVIGLLVLVLGIFSLSVVEYRKQKTAWVLFGLIWFFVMLVPGSGIIPINGILYEHWLYVPSVGLWLIAYGLWRLANSLLPVAYGKFLFAIRHMLYAFVILLCVLYMFLTIKQNQVWADPITFYTYTLSFAPDSARLHNNLGMSLANAGRAKEAITEYQKALGFGFAYPQIYNNLGNAEIAVGEYEDAEKNLKKALQLSPNFGVAKMNLIKLYIVSKQFTKAEEMAKGNAQLLGEIRKIESSK